jgi:murein DD-endopeptidase MepM/ murein hydrolase activator NlpD
VRRTRWRPWLSITLSLSLLVVGAISYFGWRQSVPGVAASFSEPPAFVGLKTPLSLMLQAARGGVRSVEVRVVQGTNRVAAVRKEFSPPLKNQEQIQLVVEGKSLGLKEGSARLEVYASDGFWRPLSFADQPILAHPVTLDLTPPTLDLLAATQYVNQGGGGLVVYRSKGARRSGVNAGGLFFPGFPVGDPESGNHVAFLALSFNFQAATPILFTASDEAGNVVSRAVASTILPKKFPADKVELTEELLRRKLPELLPERGEISDDQLLSAFLTVNRDKRREAEDTKRQVSARSQPKPLWRGAFVQPRNTKVFSNFAERRSYRFRGQEVDSQVHWGYDLASFKESVVPAANSGQVVFAGPLTIYGNAVIVDHGLGLATLYGHLSRIDVKVGDPVEKGAPLGRTGSTGLAIGDHLHYEVLIHGIPVSPLEWWDGKWIRDHILKPLREAGIALIQDEDAREEPKTPAQPARRRRR